MRVEWSNIGGSGVSFSWTLIASVAFGKMFMGVQEVTYNLLNQSVAECDGFVPCRVF